ncbi:GAF domain-containing protein [Paraflavitalea sp. CAU 1676]|uniref:GAF domain-containing protein n=1 Tax=Paraflavitalea sp. CAU 1676 TaxID=3032598 RepID=UPI0023D9DF2E|nr:GAF domain-containing protein [Paraflavitalea sp. CAU 1676]MDF2190386.1 GAF domain-containing protein [Paraflavitalea sp. CAU 1676]
MKKQVLDYSDPSWSERGLSCSISFTPFLHWLRKMVVDEPTVRRHFYRQVLDRFEAHPGLPDEIPVAAIQQYEELLEWMYACLTPGESGKAMMWSLWVPVQPVMFYGTNAFYDLIQLYKIDLAHRSPEDFRREQLQMVYTYVLRKLYHFQSRQNDYYHAYLNPATDLLQYYTISINADFIDVVPKGALPPLDLTRLHQWLQEGAGYDALESALPLDLFHFTGISIATITDVTGQHALNNLREVKLSRKRDEQEAGYRTIIRSLKTLVRNNHIQFDLFPLVQVNGKYVYGYEVGGTGILYSVWGDSNLTPEQFEQQAAGYAANPKSFFSRDVQAESTEGRGWLSHFVKAGVRSMATMPIFNGDKMVGTFCMYTMGDEQFDEQAMALLETALPAIGQILQVYIDEFALEIDDIIREKYTSIQPAVRWKFREAAWQHLYQKKKQLPAAQVGIQFNGLHPIYGAIDIRNSSVERNTAIRADLTTHLQLLQATLTQLQAVHSSSLMDQVFFTIRKWQQLLSGDILGAADEASINHYLAIEVEAWLDHLMVQHPDAAQTIRQYRAMIEGADSAVFTNRRALEQSMQMINNAISNYLDAENAQLQQLYPCYFEKFRTDGLEYDCYIGQSIAPDKPFDHFYLKGIRLWQLSSMAAIARITRELMPEMPVPLRTTQLIFVHDHTIDISFRTDERRFDVEGAYNIRYQMIKKRIDKVHVRSTGERLTQPDKLAIIYFNRNDLADYLPYLQYLQETGIFQEGLEELELEPLQGVSGLHAIRVGIT